MTRSALRHEAGDVTLEVDADAGGRISRLTVGPYDVLVGPAADPLAWGCYPMAPWAGRVGLGRLDWQGETFDLEPTMPPHAIHGTTYRRAWEVVDAQTLRTDLGDGWPFDGEAIQRFSLTADSLTMGLEVRTNDRPFPATIGWHPWFRREVAGASARLSFHADAMYERGPDHLPTGRLIEPPAGPWDDAFTALTGPASIRWGDRFGLTVESDLDHLVVYDEPAHAVCVEPQSGPPNAFVLDRAALVTPEKPLTGTMRWRWTTSRGASASAG